MFTSDSGTHPYRIVATSIPEDLPVGEKIEVSARVTGFFFKREGYDTPGGLHVAPVLLARQIGRFRRTSAPAPELDMVPYVLGMVGFIGSSLALILWYFSVTDRPRERLAASRLRTPPAIDLNSLRDLQTTEIGEILQQFSLLHQSEPPHESPEAAAESPATSAPADEPTRADD
jgi:hypothetical protein